MAVSELSDLESDGPAKMAAISPPTTPPLVSEANSLERLNQGFYWAQADIGEHFWAFHAAQLPSTLAQCECSEEDIASQEVRSDLGYFDPLLRPPACPSVNCPGASIPIFTLIMPRESGYITKSDFFQIRLQDFYHPRIAAVLERTEALSFYISPIAQGLNRSDLVNGAPCIIRWENLDNIEGEADVSTFAMQQQFSLITAELQLRFNHAVWLSRVPIPRKRVALVRGRPNITAGRPVYRAANALGLDLVIVDDAGHWLEKNREHREAFLATDMTEDAGVVGRIIASLKAYPLPIHGVFTLSDNFFVIVAKVAEALGLPTSPVSALETAVDKYRSRLLQDSPGQTARVSSVQELEALLEAPRDGTQPSFSPSFPMIVKPTKGWSSECVSKVSKLEDLATAVEKATGRHGSAAVIEPFFDGPEIDANFILIDGKFVFCEIADEPPCSADDPNATVEDTFSPVALTLPSVLPIEEQRMAYCVLGKILIKLGFRTGVFHVEARMTNSRYEYRDVGNGIIDLTAKALSQLPSESVAPRLLEINARPPGYRVTLPSKHTYGVDYFAAHMLAAVGDHERLRIVANAFYEVSRSRGLSGGAQYYSRLVYVPAPAAGIVKWKAAGLSPCEDLKRRRPDLAEHISIATDYFQPGDRITTFTDGARTYVAHLLVRSVQSRLEAIRIGNEVLRSFEICVEEEGVVNESVSVIDGVIKDLRENLKDLRERMKAMEVTQEEAA